MDRAYPDFPEGQESIDSERSGRRRPAFRVPGGRRSLPVIVGLFAVPLLLLGLLSWLGRAADEAGSATAVPIPTATAPVIAVPPTLPPTATVMATATPTPPSERTHVVASGDTLSSLARKYYGDPSKYLKIYEANREILKTPDVLQVGQRLRIPE